MVKTAVNASIGIPFTDFVDCRAKRRLFYSEASRVRHIA